MTPQEYQLHCRAKNVAEANRAIVKYLPTLNAKMAGLPLTKELVKQCGDEVVGYLQGLHRSGEINMRGIELRITEDEEIPGGMKIHAI